MSERLEPFTVSTLTGFGTLSAQCPKAAVSPRMVRERKGNFITCQRAHSVTGRAERRHAAYHRPGRLVHGACWGEALPVSTWASASTEIQRATARAGSHGQSAAASSNAFSGIHLRL